MIEEHNIYFIDWGDGMFADPFLDLAFFSIMMDYNLNEEDYFIKCYLGHSPELNEKKRYRIAKKMNYARLALSGQGIGNEINLVLNDCNFIREPHQNWSYYSKMFANESNTLSSQFFWGLAQVALDSAKAIN